MLHPKHSKETLELMIEHFTKANKKTLVILQHVHCSRVSTRLMQTDRWHERFEFLDADYTMEMFATQCISALKSVGSEATSLQIQP